MGTGNRENVLSDFPGPCNSPDAVTQALMRELAEASTKEEAAGIYLSALVKAGVITEAEAEEIRAEAG